MTLTIIKIKNVLDEGTSETAMAIVVQLDRNEVRVRSGVLAPEVRALSAEAEPNKRFVKSLTPSPTQCRSAYPLGRLIILQVTSQVVDALTLPGRNIRG